MYELDLSGKSPDNLVVGERQIIANSQNAFRCFVPAYAPFFAESLVLAQIVGGKRVQLIEGIHYDLSHYYNEGVVATKRRVYGSIMLKEPMAGVLEFSQYQTLGGSSNTSKTAIAEHLGSPTLPDPRNIDWAEVLKISTVSMAFDKPTSYGAAMATDEIIAAVELITQNIEKTIGGTLDQAYLSLQRGIANLHGRMITEGYFTHWDDPVAHGVSVDTTGSYAEDAVVENTLQAYGMTVSELAQYCLERGVSQAQVDKLLGDAVAITSTVKLTSSSPIEIPGSGVVITESDKGTTVSAPGGVTIQADLGQKRSGISASMHSGTHVLSAYSAGSNYRVEDAIRLDGFPLVDKNNLSKYLSGMSAGTAALNLKTQNTDTVTLSGNGSAGSPLSGVAKYPIATVDVKGLMKVTNTVNNMPGGYGVSTRILYELDKTVSQFALGIYTLNGQPFNVNIMLTLADFGLGKVNNTALPDKPLSDPWKAAAAGLADVGHKHYMHNEYAKATPTVAGMAQLTDTKSKTVTDRAVSVKLAKQYLNELTTEAGKTVKVLVGRTLQIGQVPASAPRIVKNGTFIAFEVTNVN